VCSSDLAQVEKEKAAAATAPVAKDKPGPTQKK
jgi:hypothetical protein